MSKLKLEKRMYIGASNHSERANVSGHSLKLAFVLASLALVATAPLSLAFAADAPNAAAQANSKILSVLSQRHMTTTPQDLETLAGGREAVISELLALRTYAGLPFVGPRAAKFLLEYADDTTVQQAMQEDFKGQDHLGLARVYSVHVDKIKQPEARLAVARMATKKASEDSEFVPYAKGLLYSSDGEVKKLAREVLK